ncbi:flavin-containing monooxygenase [Bacillus sp. JJ722]|uniref:flavin-containing monooxygenase n=1 Tax=Bacillus sp. JJ722 TaxID=3122973 RepID=UPI002FFED6AD
MFTQIDAVVVGAGFSGMYMLHSLREAGFSVRVYEAGDNVGGVWHWNRYPGARCDSESIYYNYTFSQELLQEWTWSSRYPAQPEILSYLNYVADKFNLRQDIQFNTRITAAHYDETNSRWKIQTDDGNILLAKYFITGVGCLSTTNIPSFKGLNSFKGECYHTGSWPHEQVDFKGKRVGVIGNGSTGIQAIPVIAKEAEHLFTFQRTPQYSQPAKNHSLDSEFLRKTKENYREIAQQMRDSSYGVPAISPTRSALEVTPEERERIFEKVWETGGSLFGSFNDIAINEEANKTVAEFVRSKIQQIVRDPKVAEKLMPSYYYGTKRPIKDTDYFETFNRENVTLVNVKQDPIVEITPNGIRTEEAEYELDVIVFATGYDAITGTLLKIDICGRDGLSLKEKWANGAQVKTYLGIANSGFPNMFMITGPESPSAFSNAPVSIEQHVEWITECILQLRENGVETIEANVEAEEAWSKHCREVADATLFTKTDSWYTGANIDGKPRAFSIYLGGVGTYRQKCNEVAANGYEGFSLMSSKSTVV